MFMLGSSHRLNDVAEPSLFSAIVDWPGERRVRRLSAVGCRPSARRGVYIWRGHMPPPADCDGRIFLVVKSKGRKGETTSATLRKLQHRWPHA